MIKILKQWQFLLLAIALIISIVNIVPASSGGVVVKTIAPDSPFFNVLKVGETITWANEKNINEPEDFYAFENFTGSLRFLHSGKLEIVSVDKYLGITVSKNPITKLQFGLDIIGGTRILLEPKDVSNVSDVIIQQIISVLETRINTYGLKEARFQQINDIITGKKYIQIEFAGGTKEEAEELLSKQGKFEAKIPKAVLLKNNTGTLKLGDKNYTVLLKNGSVEVDGKLLKINDTITIGDMEIQFLNISEGRPVFLFTVFTGADIKSVCLVEQPNICTSRIFQRAPNAWEFMFSVRISDEGAKRFADVTRGMQTIVDPRSGQSYLESKIYLSIDGKYISDLTIASDLAGKEVTNPLITGSAPSRTEASTEMLKLKSILQSGALPVAINIVKIDQISATLGKEFASGAMFAALAALAAIFVVLFIRYKEIKLPALMVLWSFFELILILGAAAMIKWTIDLPAIAGIIAIIGTGVDIQIMIVDELVVGRHEQAAYTLKQKIKKALFLVFGSASTIIAAMLPLTFVGIGVMRGFAITTIIGVLIGIFITRPAFARLAEMIIEKMA